MGDKKFQFEGIGTSWEIDFYDYDVDLEGLKGRIKRLVEEFDLRYSRFRTDSWVWKVSQKIGQYMLPPDGKKIFDLYNKLYKLTGGRLTPLVGGVLSDLGYDRMYSFRAKEVSAAKKWDETVELMSNQITVKDKILIDFGAMGKGYLVDQIADLLKSEGLKSFCINGGGDIYIWNHLEKVGLESPIDSSQVIGVVEISNGSICASATNRRVWGQYHHIIDPETLTSTVGIIATWVMAKEAILADVLATCLFLVPVEKLLEQFEFEYLILDEKLGARYSCAFQGRLFSATN